MIELQFIEQWGANDSWTLMHLTPSTSYILWWDFHQTIKFCLVFIFILFTVHLLNLFGRFNIPDKTCWRCIDECKRKNNLFCQQFPFLCLKGFFFFFFFCMHAIHILDWNFWVCSSCKADNKLPDGKED